MRVPHQKRGWPKGRPRPPRLATALAQTLAPSPVQVHTQHVLNGRGGASVAGKPLNGPSVLSKVQPPPQRPAATAPSLGPSPTPSAPEVSPAITTLVVDHTGVLQSATGRDPTVFGYRCADLVGYNLFSLMVADDVVLAARALEVARSLPGVVIPSLIRFVDPGKLPVWAEVSVSTTDPAARTLRLDVAPTRHVAVSTDASNSPATGYATPTGGGQPPPAFRNAAPPAAVSGTGETGLPEGFVGFTIRHTVRAGAGSRAGAGVVAAARLTGGIDRRRATDAMRRQLDGVIEDVTSDVERILGYAPHELVGVNLGNLLFSDDKPMADHMNEMVRARRTLRRKRSRTV